MDTTKGWTMASLALWVLAALLALRLALVVWPGTRPPAGESPQAVALPGAFRWPAPAAGLWQRLRSGEPATAVPTAGSLAARYRLAGVFLILSDDGRGGGEDRCAILDERQTQQQFMATEGEWIDDIRVVRVERDHVVLSDGTREELLMLAARTLGGGRVTRQRCRPRMSPEFWKPIALATGWARTAGRSAVRPCSTITRR